MKRFYFLLVTALFGLTCTIFSQAPATPAQTPPAPQLGGQPAKHSGKSYVWVYFQENFKGTPKLVPVPSELSNDARLKELGIPNDSIMSMKVPEGVVVTLYDNAAYGGKNQSFTGKCPTLGEMKGLASSLKAEYK